MAAIGSMFKNMIGAMTGGDGIVYTRGAPIDVYLKECPEDEATLLKKKSFIIDHGTYHTAVDSERMPGPPMGRAVEALATPPVEFNVRLAEDWKEGELLKIQGPHGPIEVEAPPDAVPGKELKYRLAPKYEFRVEVPPELRPGQHAKFVRPDGVEIQVQVPPNLRPGDTFEVLPPALMVRVPDGMAAGDFVVFGHQVMTPQRIQATEWCRCQVPPGYNPGQYFAARLPLPGDVPRPPPRQIPRAQEPPIREEAPGGPEDEKAASEEPEEQALTQAEATGAEPFL